MMKIITNNLFLKFLAIICALCVWSYVYITESKNVKLPFDIPIEVKGLDQGLVTIISSEQKSVFLTVNAERNSWQGLKQEDFIAYVDLTGVGEGNYEVEMKATSKNPSISVSSISPSKITISIEKASTKDIPVIAKSEGTPGENLVVSALKTEPSTVTAKGPQSAINSLISAQAIVNVENEISNLNKNVKLIGLDKDGVELKNISFTPEEVAVEVQIGKGGLTKLIAIKPKLEGTVAQGKWMSNYSVSPSSVAATFSGEMEDVKFIETNTINISNLSLDKEFVTKLIIPEGIEIEDKNISVRVTINISSINTTKEQPLGFYFTNLSGLKISTFTPNTITGQISGPNDVLSTLNSSNSYFEIDLSNFKSPGAYTIDLNNSMIRLPINSSLVSFMPSAIQINLENK